MIYIQCVKAILVGLLMLVFVNGEQSVLQLFTDKPCYNIGENVSLHGQYNGDLETIRLTLGKDIKTFNATSGQSVFTVPGGYLENATCTFTHVNNFTVVIPEVTIGHLNASLTVFGLPNKDSNSVTLKQCSNTGGVIAQSPVGSVNMIVAIVVIALIAVVIALIVIVIVIRRRSPENYERLKVLLSKVRCQQRKRIAGNAKVNEDVNPMISHDGQQQKMQEIDD